MKRYLKQLPAIHLVLIGVLVIALAACVFLSREASSADEETVNLAAELTRKNQELAVLQNAPQIDSLVDKLAKLDGDLVALESSMDFLLNPGVSGQSITVYLPASAEADGVNLQRFDWTSQSAVELIGHTNYEKDSYVIAVSGDLRDIEEFIEAIEEGPFPLIRVRDIRFVQSADGWTSDFTLDVLVPKIQ